jgi:hypothetical protein
MLELNVDFCNSSFDTDPFGPQSNGSGTIFPYWVKRKSDNKEFLELPYTLVQDFFLFILLGEKNIHIWKDKLDWIAIKGGMAFLVCHPDYINFESKKFSMEEYPHEYYENFLKLLNIKYEEKFWHALPNRVHEYLLKLKYIN